MMTVFSLFRISPPLHRLYTHVSFHAHTDTHPRRSRSGRPVLQPNHIAHVKHVRDALEVMQPIGPQPIGPPSAHGRASYLVECPHSPCPWRPLSVVYDVRTKATTTHWNICTRNRSHFWKCAEANASSSASPTAGPPPAGGTLGVGVFCQSSAVSL